MSSVIRLDSSILADVIRTRTAALAGCGGSCGGACSTCAPPGIVITDRDAWLPGGKFGAAAGSEPNGDRAHDARCLVPLPSTLVPVAAGATVNVRIQPTRGCFDAFYAKVIAVDAANPQTQQRVLIGRIYVGSDCPQDCRINPMYSDFFESDDCLGCPLRATFGLAGLNDDLQIEVTNPNAAGTVNVQVTVWGVCRRSAAQCA